jgi:ABC-2 type transport system ATP-binding protein
MAAIEVHELRRIYETTTGLVKRRKKEIVALEKVNLSVAAGELFGLLGPNGAGKTTLTKIIATILLPTSGSVSALGLDVVRDEAALRRRIGILFGGERGLYWRLSGRANMQYFADLYRVSLSVARTRIPELLELVGLAERADERVEGYSKGMKQRLHVARALINDPDLILLDEPTIGLDPLAAREIREVIRDLRSAGKTIFLTSHYMYEIDALCDRVAVLNKGNILLVDTPAALKSQVADLEVVEIECYGAPRETIDRLRAHPRITGVNVETREQKQVLQIQAPAGSEYVQEFMHILDGVRVEKVITRQPTLEDAYIRLVGKEALQT